MGVLVKETIAYQFLLIDDIKFCLKFLKKILALILKSITKTVVTVNYTNQMY